MFQISKNNIKLIRGDTGEVELNLTLDDEEKTVVEPEAYEAVFTLKKNVDDIAFIMQKPFVDGKITFSHEDTNLLPYGVYIYDVQVKVLEDGSIHTIGQHSFVILADVTRE